MLYLLIALTLVFWAFHYRINGRQLLSPTIIIVGVYLATLTFSLFARKHYGINDISVDMVIVVFLSFLFLGLGESAAITQYNHNKTRLPYNREENSFCQPIYNEYLIGKITVYVFFLFSLYVAYWSLRDLVSFAARNGIGGDFISTFTKARSWMAKGLITYNRGTLLEQATTICGSFSYICIYIFLYDLIFCKKIKLYCLLPVIGNMLILVSSTGRVAFIRVFTVMIAIAIVFMKTKTGWSREKDGKILKISVISVVVFLILFRILGYLTSKSARSDPLENFYAYIAAGVFGFDDFITSPRTPNTVFGQHAFYSIYTILNIFGFGIPLGSQFNAARTIGTKGLGTVMGTGLLVPVQDFGVIGMLLTRVLIGYVYQRIFLKIKHNPDYVNRPILMIFFGIVMYPIVMSSIDDAFRSLVSLGYIYTLFYIYIFLKLFVRRRGND